MSGLDFGRGSITLELDLDFGGQDSLGRWGASLVALGGAGPQRHELAMTSRVDRRPSQFAARVREFVRVFERIGNERQTGSFYTGRDAARD
jgi:hypothetical protein